MIVEQPELENAAHHEIEAVDLELQRQFYAEEIGAVAQGATAALIAAFARVPRESSWGRHRGISAANPFSGSPSIELQAIPATCTTMSWLP